MSLANYEWYGWICFVLAIASSLGFATQLIGFARGTLKPSTVVLPYEAVIAATLVALSLWMALP